MKKTRLYYKKKRNNIPMLLLTLIILLAVSTVLSMNLISTPRRNNLSILGNIVDTKKSDNLLEQNSEDDSIPNSNDNKEQNNQNKEEEQATNNKPTEDNVKEDIVKDPTLSYSVPAEEVYSYGRKEGKKYVFLTFDDGPNTKITPKVLEILKKYDAHATFFVLGSAVDNNPEVLKEIFNNGHALANHTYSHDYKILYPKKTVDIEAFKGELEKTTKSIINILGSPSSSRVVRFPAGSFESWKKPMREELIKSGLYYIDWNAENKDGLKNNATVEEQLSSIKNNITAAESSNKNLVILMHDSPVKKTTVDALPYILELLQSKGYEFRTIR